MIVSQPSSVNVDCSVLPLFIKFTIGIWLLKSQTAHFPNNPENMLKFNERRTGRKNGKSERKRPGISVFNKIKIHLIP